MKKLSTVLLIGLLATPFSCRKFVDPGKPVSQLDRRVVFSSENTATAAILAIYANLEYSLLLGDLVVFTGMSADEFKNASSSIEYQDIYNCNINPSSNVTDDFWKRIYSLIYQCNAVIEGVTESPTLSIQVKKQIAAEAKFIRAFLYFNLMNLYGSVPLVISTKFEENVRIPRAELQQIYVFLKSDLEGIRNDLPDDYRSRTNSITSERLRANKACLDALLSKIYLYGSEWQESAKCATSVISQSDKYILLNSLSDIFLKNSKEQIWEIQPTLPGFNCYTGFLLILTYDPYLVYLDEANLAIYEANDSRPAKWIGIYNSGSTKYYFSYKYKVAFSSVVTEYTSVFRLAEVVLNRAEARARVNDVAGGLEDLNKIRERAGISTISSITQGALLDSILLERRRELLAEGANRWFDLKRTHLVDSVMGSKKGANWKPSDGLYPIPQSELLRNSSLTQNPGY